MAYQRSTDPASTDPGNDLQLNHTEKRLTRYAMAATAASVGVLALAQPAQSAVVIKNTNIPIESGLTLDLNNDGTPDLEFSFIFTEGHSVVFSDLDVLAFKGNAVVEQDFYVSALMRGARIGPSAHFGGTGGNVQYVMEGQPCTYNGCRTVGKWGGNHPNRFLGVKFKINGKTHYGWVRITVNVNTNSRMTATITEYGYETIPNRPVKAGLPSSNVAASAPAGPFPDASAGSLGVLAAGADGLAIWRREDDGLRYEA